tara:strand:- start:2 stop:160 length:159 start_codon:yes stop_codon:yes gene_type:complete
LNKIVSDPTFSLYTFHEKYRKINVNKIAAIPYISPKNPKYHGDGDIKIKDIE